MRLNSIVCAMIDWSHIEHVFKITEGPLDFRQLFVNLHRLHRREISLLGLNNVLALIRLLPSEVDGVFKECEYSFLQRPIIVAMTVVAAEDCPSGSTNLLW